MLYLAEVRKQTKGFIGGSKTELKLLACERNDKTWSAVPGDEVVPGDEASSFSEGVLVIVNLGNNRQVQGSIEAAGNRVVGILQNFSRILEKTKGQEEEIEQWKQSLTYQSQELNRREMEMEARLEQLEHMEEDLARLEQQRKEIEISRQEFSTLKEEFERKQRDLEGAWEHLRGEQQRLNERKQDADQSLNEEQTEALRGLVASLEVSALTPDSLRSRLEPLLTSLTEQQELLNEQWQQLEQNRQQLGQKQGDAERQGGDLQQNQQQFQETLQSLEKAKLELQTQQQVLMTKQEALQMLNLDVQQREELKDAIKRLSLDAGSSHLGQKIDIEALESMPLGELQEKVDSLKLELEKAVRFVNDLEEELNLQRQSVGALDEQLKSANEYDRISLEQELKDEQDSYTLLNQSLVGSRHNLLAAEGEYQQHLRVLRRRQGTVDDQIGTQGVNLEPLLEQLEEQQQQQDEQRQILENQIEQMHKSMQQVEEMIQQQSSQLKVKQSELETQESHWQQLKGEVLAMEARIRVYEEMLRPWQDRLTKLREQLESLRELGEQGEGDYEQQQRAIAQVKSNLGALLVAA